MKQLSRLRFVATAALLAIASSCASVNFRGQDLALDFDAKSDSVTFEIEYRDIGPETSTIFGKPDTGKMHDQSFATANKFVSRVVRGDVTFIAFSLLGDWDLDGVAKDPDNDPEMRKFFGDVKVVEARAYLGRGERLNLYQKIEVPNISAGLALLNSGLREFALGSDMDELLADGSDADISLLEIRNLEIFRADAKMGKDWITWSEAGLEFRLPLCSEYSLVTLRRFLLDAGDSKDSYTLDSFLTMGQFLAAAKDLRIESDHLVLVFGDKDGDMAFSFAGGSFDGEPDLRKGFVQHLKDGGMTFPATYPKDE